METLSEAHDKILKEILLDDSEVRAEFLKNFKEDATKFSCAMARAFLAWRELDAKASEKENLKWVSALVFTSLNLHIQSMKLLLSGHLVAAGNLSRQVVEAIALALLCSGKELNVLERFLEDKYSTSKAVRDLLSHWERLSLLKEGVTALEDAQEFYHKYSHPTKLTIAAIISFPEKNIYVGSSFDQGKLDAYVKEVNGRVGLAEVFENFVEAVKANVDNW
jgi:hypothetical protein